MIQKVLKIGASIGVTIPKKTAQDLGISAGDSVEFTVEPLATVNKELVTWTKDFIQKYRPALEALAKK